MIDECAAALPPALRHVKSTDPSVIFDTDRKRHCLTAHLFQKMRKAGWDGRIRTYDTRYQKPMPYHLATSQQRGAGYCEERSGSSPVLQKSRLFLLAVRVQNQFGPIAVESCISHARAHGGF